MGTALALGMLPGRPVPALPHPLRPSGAPCPNASGCCPASTPPHPLEGVSLWEVSSRWQRSSPIFHVLTCGHRCLPAPLPRHHTCHPALHSSSGFRGYFSWLTHIPIICTNMQHTPTRTHTDTHTPPHGHTLTPQHTHITQTF